MDGLVPGTLLGIGLIMILMMGYSFGRVDERQDVKSYGCEAYIAAHK